MLVYALWELSRIKKKDKEETQYHYRICAPNLRVHPDSMRLPELANAAFFAEISKFLQKNFFASWAANLTVDEAMCFDFGMWVAERINSKDLLWNLPVVARQMLDDNFALTPAVAPGEKDVPTIQEKAQEGFRELGRIVEDVKVAAFAGSQKSRVCGEIPRTQDHNETPAGQS